jgi:hypothetical protein
MVLPVVTRGMMEPFGDPKIFDSIDFKVAINHRHGVSTHLRCTRLVPEARGCIANEVFKLATFQLS